MADLNDELNKAAKEFKEIVGNLKSSEKTKDAVQELQEIKEQIEKSSSSNLKEIKQFKEETKERITKSAVYDEEATNRSIFSAKSLFSCSGRLGKIGYGVINVLLYILLVSIMYGLFRLERYTRAYTIVDMLILITYAGFCTLYIIALIRRLHDCGKNGVPTLLAIPLLVMCHSYGYDWHMAPFYIGIVVALIMFIQPGTDGDNAYGPVPPEFSLKNAISTVSLSEKIIFIRGKIKSAVAKMNMLLKSKKRYVAWGISVVTVLSCIGVYFYIPKMSDVEKYKANRDTTKLIQLIDETTENQSFLDVRSEAIKALVVLDDEESDVYIERELHKKSGNFDLRDEFIKYCKENDKDFVLNRVKRYRNIFDKIADEEFFGSVCKYQYDRMMHLSEITKDDVALAYSVETIGIDCVNFIGKDVLKETDVRNYLVKYIETYGEFFPDPYKAEDYAFAIKNYDNCVKSINSLEDSIKSLDQERSSLYNKKRERLYGFVINKYSSNLYDVNVGYGRIVSLQTIETEYFTEGYIRLPVLKTGYDTYIEDTSARKDGERVYEIDNEIFRLQKDLKIRKQTKNNFINSVKSSFMLLERSLKNIKVVGTFLGIDWDKLIEKQPINFKFKLASGGSLIYECTEAEKLKLDEVLPLDKITVVDTQFNTKKKVLEEIYIHTKGNHQAVKQYLTSKYGTPIKGRYYDIWEVGQISISYNVGSNNYGRMNVRTKEYQDALETSNW